MKDDFAQAGQLLNELNVEDVPSEAVSALAAWLTENLPTKDPEQYTTTLRRFLTFLTASDLLYDQFPLIAVILLSAQRQKVDLNPLLELVFDEALRRWPQDFSPTAAYLIDPDESADTAVVSPPQWELPPEQLIRRRKTAKLLLASAARVGRPALDFALRKAEDDDEAVRNTAYELICSSPVLTDNEIAPLLERLRFALALATDFPKIGGAETRSTKGTWLRGWVLAAARRHPEVRLCLAMLYTGIFADVYRNGAHLLAEGVLLPLLEFDNTAESIISGLRHWYPNVIPVAIKRLNDAALKPRLVELLAGYGTQAVPMLIDALSDEPLVAAIGEVFARMGVVAVRPLAAALPNQRQCAQSIVEILRQMGPQARRALLAHLAAELSDGENPPFSDFVPVWRGDLVCELDAALDDERFIAAAMFLLLELGQPAEMPLQNAQLLTAAIKSSLPQIIALLQKLPDELRLSHPVAQAVIENADAGIARKLMKLINPANAVTLRALLSRMGENALAQIRLLLASGRANLVREGEAIVQAIDLPDRIKYPWLASLFAGGDDNLHYVLLKLLTPMALPESRSCYRFAIGGTSSDDSKLAALKGLSRLKQSLQLELLPELCRLVCHGSEHVCQQTATIVGSLGKAAKPAESALRTRLETAKTGTALHRCLTRALKAIG